MKLCCFFNYAPLYREAIYRAIDESFDAQFYFGQEVHEGQNSGIARIDYEVFRKKPIEFKNKTIFGRFGWRTKSAGIALKKYDTYLITGDFVFSYIPLLLLCKVFKKRVFAWGHGIKRKSRRFQFFYDFFYGNLTGFFSYGELGKEQLIKLGYAEDKIHVIYNSLGDRNDITTNKRSDIFQKHFGNSDPTLIFIGRLTPAKQLDWLIKVLALLNNRNQKCNLAIVGDGQCGPQLRELASKLGIEKRIWFYGECYSASITSELLYNAEVCVSPGNVGLTAIDSMRNGTPVISHGDFEAQGPEFETIIPHKTGDLYEKDNFEDLYAKVQQWLDFSKDNRELIRTECYKIIQDKWNSDNQLDIFKSVIVTKCFGRS